MPNASAEVGGLDLNGDARRGEAEGRGGHKNLFCFFVPTVAFQRYQIAGPPRLSGWSQIAFGTVRGERSVASRVFVFYAAAAALYLPIASPSAASSSLCVCMRALVRGTREG